MKLETLVHKDTAHWVSAHAHTLVAVIFFAPNDCWLSLPREMYFSDHISMDIPTWIYSNNEGTTCYQNHDASFVLFLYYNVVHLSGMQQPDKVSVFIVFFSGAIWCNSFDSLILPGLPHLTTSLSSSPHSRCAQD